MMSETNVLFMPTEFVLFQARRKNLMLGAAKAPFIGVMTGLQTVTLAAVAYVEYEIIFRVFEFLSGDDEYWSPEVMGLTAVVMILGFHLMAKRFPGNFAARFVTKTVQFLIPLYMLGIGLLIASIMDVWSLLEELPPVVLGGLPAPSASVGLGTFFEGITDPVAALSFSLGLGGLAIVNIFVAHELLSKISASVADFSGRVAVAKQAFKDYSAIKRAHQRYSACVRELAKLDLWTDDVVRLTVATTALEERDDALRPHKEWLADHRLGESSPFQLNDTADPAVVSKMIKPLEAISLEDVLQALEPPRRLEKKL